MDYGALTPMLAEAIKELNNKTMEQQKIIVNQNGTINPLNQDIQTLKAQMQELCKKDKSYSWC